MDSIKKEQAGISVQGIRINNLRFADDIDIIEEDEEKVKN
jgi:hypothetical protein